MRVTVAAWIGSANAGDELIHAALRRKLLARGAHVTAVTMHPDPGPSAVRHRDPVALARAVRASDALVFGGGGLLQDQTSSFNLPYHLSRLALARLPGTRRAVVGVGVGPLRTVAGRAQVRRALQGITAVSGRDAAPAELLDVEHLAPGARRLAERDAIELVRDFLGRDYDFSAYERFLAH